MKEWFEAFDFIFEKLKPRWKRRDGFLIASCALIATQVFFADSVHSLLKNVPQSKVFWILTITAYGVPHILHYTLWLCLSGRLIFAKRPFVVAFCVKRYDTLSHLYYSESLSRLQQLLKACNLLEKFLLVDMGSDVVRDNAEAAKLVERSRIKILVHGDIFSGTENGEQTHEHKLQITWKNPPVLGREIQITNQLDSQLFVGHRDWHIRESTSKADKEKIADSFHEIILLLAVLSQLTDRNQVQMNLRLLETLVNHLEIATRNDKPIVENGGKSIRLSVPLIRKGRVMFLIKELYREFGRLCIADSDYRNAVIYFERALKIAGPNTPILIGLAFSYYHLDEYEKAKQASLSIHQESPDHPTYLVNMGFLFLIEKNYSEALKYYKKIVLLQPDAHSLILSIIEFLSERQKSAPDELGYNFAIGALNFAFADEKAGRRELRSFNEQAAKNPQLAGMIVSVPPRPW